jgi:hypothetical protein
VLGVVLALFAGACGDHEPVLDRVGGPLPDYDAAAVQDTGDASDASVCELPPADSPGAMFPCEVDAVLADKCRRCHQDPMVDGAPFPLLEWKKTQEVYSGKPIWQRMQAAVGSGYMPFCANLACANNYDPPVQPLTALQKKTLLDWLACPKPALGVGCQD